MQTFALPLGYHANTWSGRRDSDSRPPPWQGGALPTELLPQNDGDRRRRGKQALMKTGAGEETRTHTPVAPDPKSGASAIPPRPHAAYDPHGASAPDSQIRTLIYYTLCAVACQGGNGNFFLRRYRGCSPAARKQKAGDGGGIRAVRPSP